MPHRPRYCGGWSRSWKCGEVEPYRGLEAFTADDAVWFHGRDTAVESALATLAGLPRVLLLLGPSGAGKSSLVQAGLLPVLRDGAVPGSDRWLTVSTRPAGDLPARLEHAGLPGAMCDGIPAAARHRLAAEPNAERLLLIIDQFEELLTQPSTGSMPRSSTAQSPAGGDRPPICGTVLAGLLALALTAAGLAWRQQEIATTAQHEAQSRQLAAQSDTLIGTNPDLASLLAVQAYPTSPTDDATASLYRAAALPIKQILGGEEYCEVFSLKGGIHATDTSDKTVRLWDTVTGKHRHTLAGHTDTVNAAVFSPDGATLAVIGSGTVRLWDTVTMTGRDVGISSVTQANSRAESVAPWSVHTRISPT
ncbi:hypothetical protein [Streptomyces albipurpureus]|uniref:Novel STAND NTPase 1 domain-containing protein n=1 Tax=Streptomyces albipurpureus TaxID=2897419 RepID=A0ABT0UFI6_9ACTN|nr:hypothetical protein [Streptomyces sp. CWNU-1]MCM2387379.1 hypothetical protein [Streptomyces sp. CWNU-1]